MTMSPMYSYGKPCSRGPHNETEKNFALSSSIINGIDDCTKDGGEELFTKMQCIFYSNSYRIVEDS